jgi:hypothetical protein
MCNQDARPVYIPTGNPDTVNAENYAPGEVGTCYTSNRKKYQITVIDPSLAAFIGSKNPTDPKAADGTDNGPIRDGTVAYWKDRRSYTSTNATKAVIEEKKEDEATAPVAPAPTAKAPAAPATPPKVRNLKVAGVYVGPFLGPVRAGNVCHLQQRGLAKLRVAEGTAIAEDSPIGFNPMTGAILVAAAGAKDTIGTSAGPVKDGFVLVDLDIPSAD